MNYWRTSLRLYTDGKVIETEDLEIQREIFQGDSLTPLIICIILSPLEKS